MTARNRPALLLVALTTACATGSPPDETEWTNPPGCPGDAAPVAAAATPPTPLSIRMSAWPAELRLDVVDLEVIVDAQGRVDPESVRTPGHDDRRLLAWAREAVTGWRFRPARRDGCYVAAPFTWRMRPGR